MTAVTPVFVQPDLSEESLAQVTAEIASTALGHDRDGTIPTEGLLAAHRAGLLTATVGRQYGGPEVDILDMLRILVALGEGDASVALMAANSLHAHRAQAETSSWPPTFYDDLLRQSLHGPALINTVRAEPELGAPARGGLPATVATRIGNEWSLTGHKAYATGGTALAYHLVWAQLDEPDADPASPRVGHLVVPGDRPGISWTPTWDHLGLRASNTHDVIYDDVRVPLDAFIDIPRGPDGVYRDPTATTPITGLGHCALYIGVARAARAAFVDFAHTRVPAGLGRPIATTERVQGIAGEIDAQIATGETLLYGAALRVRAGDDRVLPQLGVIKVQVARSAIGAVNTAVAGLGNPALSRTNRFERLLRDVLCVRVHPPQEDTALVQAGRRLLTPPQPGNPESTTTQ